LGLLSFWLKRKGADDGGKEDRAQNHCTKKLQTTDAEGRFSGQRNGGQKDNGKTLVAAGDRAQRRSISSKASSS
jgi:hypothetical protein